MTIQRPANWFWRSVVNGGEIYIFDMGKPVKIIDLARK
jgi:FlaA1/EpsC-like NDP-sugar epimerase